MFFVDTINHVIIKRLKKYDVFALLTIKLWEKPFKPP